MIDKWKEAVDNKVLAGLSTDLSKALICYDSLCHDLLVAKLNTYDLFMI